jgi:hypothetical protein
MFNKKSLIACAGILAGLLQTTWANPSYTQAGIIDSRYVDFSAVSPYANHAKWQTWTPPGQSSGAKFITLELAGRSAGTCYSIYVSPASGTSTVNTDLRLWTMGNQSIDDNGPNGSLTPFATVWVGSTTGMVRLAAKNSGQNGIDFWLHLTELPGKATSTCRDGNTPYYNYLTGQIINQDNLSN